jgi:16S rRNA processing protein RimM
MAEPRFLLLGEILRPHGVRGELRMRILTDYPERINQLEKVYLAEESDSDDPDAYRVQHMRMHQSYGLLKLEGVDDRDQADRLREMLVMVPLENAVPLDEGEFYLYQLIGLSVRTTEGEMLGKITDVLETGANDVYVVESATYGEFLMPVTDETVLQTNIEQGFILVNLPEGLLR